MFEVIEKNCPIRIRPKPREIELRGNFSLQFSRNRLLGFLDRLTYVSFSCPRTKIDRCGSNTSIN